MDIISSNALVAVVVFVFHALGVLAAVHAAFTARTAQGAVAWAVSLATMPYLTLVPYLILGPRRFSGYITARRDLDATPRQRLDESVVTLQRGRRTQETNSSTFAAIERLANSVFAVGNHVRLLIDGEATFKAILEGIALAQHYVFVQSFIVKDDEVGWALRAELIRRAKAGCRVYFLYDGMGSHALPKHYVAALADVGVRIHSFSARSGWIHRFRINFRNHRKIVVVDGRLAFIGGHNFGVEYLKGSATLGPWRDTHVEMCGPAVAQAERFFIEDWLWVTGAPPDCVRRTSAPLGVSDVVIVGTGPVDELETCGLLFVHLIHSARSRIWITSPYFVPDDAVLSALKLAVLRGVDVRILIPSRPDHRLVYAASTLYAHEAVRAGVKVYRYQAGFLHQKVVLMDSALAAIGTANLDNRSFRLNFEITALVADAAFALEVERMLANDLSRSEAVSVSEYEKATLIRQASMHLARLFSPIL